MQYGCGVFWPNEWHLKEHVLIVKVSCWIISGKLAIDES